jgi:hypothetical protein
MTINLQETDGSLKGFINVAGVTKDTPADEANLLIEEFVRQLNNGELVFTSFKSNGKWVLGWK